MIQPMHVEHSWQSTPQRESDTASEKLQPNVHQKGFGSTHEVPAYIVEVRYQLVLSLFLLVLFCTGWHLHDLLLCNLSA